MYILENDFLDEQLILLHNQQYHKLDVVQLYLECDELALNMLLEVEVDDGQIIHIVMHTLIEIIDETLFDIYDENDETDEFVCQQRDEVEVDDFDYVDDEIDEVDEVFLISQMVEIDETVYIEIDEIDEAEIIIKIIVVDENDLDGDDVHIIEIDEIDDLHHIVRFHEMHEDDDVQCSEIDEVDEHIVKIVEINDEVVYIEIDEYDLVHAECIDV